MANGEMLASRELAENLLKTLDHNPALREPVVYLLHVCSNDRCDEDELIARAESFLAKRRALPVQPLSSVIELTVRLGGLSEEVEIDGVAYAGSIEDAFNDESLADDASVSVYATTTEAGRLVAAQCDPRERAWSLFREKPQFAEGFLYTLKLCDVKGGLSTSQLEEALDDAGFLYRDERTKLPTAYPSMYGNLLKDVGAICWDHAWITTETGRAVMAELLGDAGSAA